MKNATVLVIEDETAILNNICTILQISGYDCHKANSGLVAFEILQTVIPDIILCDVMMPDMNGFEVLQKLQDDEHLKNIPFCFLSARADIIDIDYGISLGAKGYITKPFSAKDLVQTVQNLS